MGNHYSLPSGKLLVTMRKWLIKFVDLPIPNGDEFQFAM